MMLETSTFSSVAAANRGRSKVYSNADEVSQKEENAPENGLRGASRWNVIDPFPVFLVVT